MRDRAEERQKIMTQEEYLQHCTGNTDNDFVDDAASFDREIDEVLTAIQSSLQK